jgi:hypothetical protein
MVSVQSLVVPAAFGETAASDFIPVTYVEQGPKIDGKLDDPCWLKAKEVAGFTSIEKGNPRAKNQTFVRGVYDQKCLYLAFRCIQPVTEHIPHRPRDGPLWFDDCIEMYISPHITSTLLQTQSPDEQYFRLIVNSAGDQYDELGSAGPTSWNGDWQDCATYTAEGWQVEIAIPFASLYFENFETRKNPPEMTVWRVQFGRTTAADGANSTLFPTQGLFKIHSHFGDLVFVSDPNDTAIRWKLDDSHLVSPRVAAMQSVLEQMKHESIPSLTSTANDLDQKLLGIRQEFLALKNRSYSVDARAKVLEHLTELEKTVTDAQGTAVVQKANRSGDLVAVGAHPAEVDSMRVFPHSVPALDEVGQPVTATVAPGEFKAASFVIWNSKPIEEMTVDISGLTSAGARLPGDAIDTRWVKCWYQAGDGDIVPVGCFLIPELLLKNPDMVTVDEIHQKNILLDNYHGDPTSRGYRDDSATLLPIRHLDAKTSTQVWLTVHVPVGTPPGVYGGTITVKSQVGIVAHLPIEIRVLDFTLSHSMLENNWYAQTGWGDRTWITEDRALLEMHNLINHGVDYVGLFEKRKLLPEAIRLMRKAGLATDKIYIQPHADYGISLQYDTPASVSEMAKAWLATAKAAGCDQLYLYLIDEGREDTLKAEKPLAEAIRALGAKTWVACYSNYFGIGGDFIDVANIAGGPVGSDLVQKIHSAGKKVFCYANPQGGVERPERYRRNYGLLLWQHDYDGSCDWSWYWQFGPNENPNSWDDFNHPVYRDHMMVYPTKNGLVDTIQWEGWREGVNDTRYVATLIREIAAARKRGQIKTADEADAWLLQLKNGGSAALADLEAVRNGVIEHIEQCQRAH